MSWTAASTSPRSDVPTGAREIALVVVVLVAGLVLRLALFGGYGLADDAIFWGEVRQILVTHWVIPDNQVYRFTWWFPTAALARAFGQNEVTMVAIYVAYSLVGLVLVYRLGRLLWGPWAGIVAAALLAVHPMDVTYATLMANDFALSVYSALAVLCTLRALDAGDVAARRRYWIGAGVALALCYHSKVTGVLMVPVTALIVWMGRARARDVGHLVVTAAVLFGASMLVSYVFSGSLFGPMRSELAAQTILDPVTAPQRQVTRELMWIFPDLLFRPTRFSDWMNAWYPHALLLLAVVAWPLRLRVGAPVWIWLVIAFLGLELNVQRVAGYWVAGYRNPRHALWLDYPMVLLLAGYLSALRAAWPGLATGVAVGLAATSGVAAVALATKPHVAFADARTVCGFVEETQPGTIYLDEVLRIRCTNTHQEALAAWKVEVLPASPGLRRTILAGAGDAYVVTGGGREPLLGGPEPIPLADELPTDRVERVLERSGPIAPGWRPEDLRIWKIRRAGAS